MQIDLTYRQKQILDYLHNQLKTEGYPPSVREICIATNLSSTATVHGHLVQLEKKGYIKRNPKKPRAIEIIDATIFNKNIIKVPIIGKVTAGQPILAQENIENVLSIPKEIAPDSDVFILQVEGDSMINAGILNGDYVLVRSTNTAKNGDIVVALLEDEATIKRFFKESGYFRLQPENPFMKPIIVKDLKILGKIIGLYRKF